MHFMYLVVLKSLIVFLFFRKMPTQYPWIDYWLLQIFYPTSINMLRWFLQSMILPVFKDSLSSFNHAHLDRKKDILECLDFRRMQTNSKTNVWFILILVVSSGNLKYNNYFICCQNEFNNIKRTFKNIAELGFCF